MTKPTNSAFTVQAYAGSYASTQQGVLEDLLPPRTKALAALLLILSLASHVGFWQWWTAVHSSSGWPALDLLLSVLALAYSVDDVWRQVILLRAQRINQNLATRTHFRVGMVVTKAPSEPWSVLEKTLTGALNQDYLGSYEVWLADEAPSEDTRAWCKQHGVHISTRQGITEYHRPEWPRRTRCKEGNLAYFYDHYGYKLFDIVCQFDADHVPERSYLSTLLPAFLDPQVGYAALPSICGANSDVSWAVRGRLYLEAYMHGPLGASNSKIAMPCCIGSHYAVRTSALKQIGGIGPELNEDYSTSHIMTAHGFRGVFGIDTIANGDGPENFEDCMRQEYQWARSAMVLITRYLPRYWPGQMTPLEMFRAVQCNAWWMRQSLEAIASVAVVILGPGMLGLPLSPSLDHSLLGFALVFARTVPGIVLGYCAWLLCSFSGWHRPVDARFWSWEMWLHSFCKPYWTLQGTIHGLLGGLLGINFAIKVTPKGGSGEVLMGVHNIVPFITCAAVGVIALAVGRSHFLAPLMLSCFHLVTAAAVVALHYRENHIHRSRLPRRNLLQLTLPITALALTLAAVLLLRHAVVFGDIWLGKLAATTGNPDTSCTAASVQFTRPAATNSCPLA